MSTDNTINMSNPKYLVLADAMLWRDPKTGFQLSWNTQTVEKTLRALNPKSAKALKAEEGKEPETFNPEDGDWWIAMSDIPKDPELRKMLNRAVNAGKMEFTNDYKQWLIDKQDAKASSKGKRKGLVWTEGDLERVKNRKQIPRNPSIARGTMTYADKDSKAFKLLQEASQDLRSLLPKIVGALPKEAQGPFLREALEIEKQGYNRAVTPRSAVMDLILDLMGDLGIASGIGMVVTEQEPITKNVKSIKIPGR